MPDIVTVSDSLDRLDAKTRAKSETVTLSDSVVRVVTKNVNRSLTETVNITDDTATFRAKTRIISQTTTIVEQLQAYKNDIELVPILPEPTPIVLGAGLSYPTHRKRRLVIFKTTFRIVVIAAVLTRENYPLLTVNITKKKLAVRIKKAFSSLIQIQQPKPRPKPMTFTIQLALEVKTSNVLTTETTLKIKTPDKLMTMRQQKAFVNLLKMGSFLLLEEEE